jgi:hypothetical protein
MELKTKKIIGCGAILILITVGLVGFFVYRTYSFFNQLESYKVEKAEIPNEIKEARILKGADFLKKTEMFKLTNESTFEILKRGATANEKEKERFIQSQTAKKYFGFADIKVFRDEIVAVGKFGGYVFDLQGNLKKEVLFEPTIQKISFFGFEKETFDLSLDNLEIISLDNKKYGFISDDLTTGVIVYDENGNQIWDFGKEEIDLGSIFDDENKRQESYEKSKYILSATVADLDNDGISEYLVSRKNEGIYAFNQNGSEKWFQPEEDDASGDFVVADFDNTGENEILELIGMSTKLRDIKGKVTKELEMKLGIDYLLWTETKDKTKIPQFLGIEDGKLRLNDFNQKTILESEAPLSEVKKVKSKTSPATTPKIIDENGDGIVAMPMEYTSDTESVYKPKAVWVNLKKDKSKYLAVIAPFVIIPRANFYVYDEKGSLVYHELLSEDIETITVLPAENGNDSILVGGKNTIWKFASN